MFFPICNMLKNFGQNFHKNLKCGVYQYLLDIIEENEINAVIIYGRYNPGGLHAKYSELFNVLIDAAPEGKLFYFINNASFSAGSMAPIFLKHMGATIIGEPVSQNAIFYGISRTGSISPDLTLKNSQLQITIPNFIANINHTIVGVPLYGSDEEIELFIQNNLDW